MPRVVRSHFLRHAPDFLQLILGATMRHQHAGLPVWDFPRAHGQWWPSTEENMLAKYNVIVLLFKISFREQANGFRR